MRTRTKNAAITLLALAFVLAAWLPAPAEDPVPAAGQAQSVEARNLRKEIVKLKYVRAQDIQNLLYAYVSRDGHIQFNPNMPSVLSVSDTPENVEKILAAIREIDVKPADVLFTVQLLLGTAGETDQGTKPVSENDPIIRELRNLLKYKTYSLLDATMVRTVNLENSEVQFGPKAEFQLELRPEVTGDAKMPVIKSGVRLRQIKRMPDSYASSGKPFEPQITTLVESTLNIKSGERTVVGVSKLDGGDKGLILIISAKIVE
ncbi:MAG TPA: hypothetical protein P5119_00135 [Candidatus Aminicenantes bacterium]|nr:hypothetical protein [Candidatus Aminicenantes bacterium]HRY63732.1 hypothetical protein [Candidatus Aminicenantes bacterium]HRZ70645.1 hypothetical protein [Candidatus Aminicenantes bacterium]